MNKLRELVRGLDDYAKDWRTRAATMEIVAEAKHILEAILKELEGAPDLTDWSTWHEDCLMDDPDLLVEAAQALQRIKVICDE
jgi:plasmid stability protein